MAVYSPESMASTASIYEYIIELTNKTNEATKEKEKHREEAAKERSKIKTTLDKLVVEMKEVSKKSADIEEWRKAMNKDLELKFEEQNKAITEAFEEQNTKLNDKFSEMMVAHKADRQASIHKLDQLT
eukprot:7830551-Ditylum_brightwellii.AAC.1